MTTRIYSNLLESTRIYTITDKITGKIRIGVPRDQIEAELAKFTPGADSPTRIIIGDLVSKLYAGEYYGDEEEFLQIDVTRS